MATFLLSTSHRTPFRVYRKVEAVEIKPGLTWERQVESLIASSAYQKWPTTDSWYNTRLLRAKKAMRAKLKLCELSVCVNTDNSNTYTLSLPHQFVRLKWERNLSAGNVCVSNVSTKEITQTQAMKTFVRQRNAQNVCAWWTMEEKNNTRTRHVPKSSEAIETVTRPTNESKHASCKVDTHRS